MLELIITDDHKIIRDGLKALLKEEENIKVVGEAGNGKELIDLLPSVCPDVILMDIHMPEMDGIETTKFIVANYPSVKVLALSMMESEEYVKAMVDAGAYGYVLKSSGKDELVNAIRIISSGFKYLSPDFALKLLNKTIPEPADFEEKVKENSKSNISKRELEVLKLIADGFTNGEIADKLFTSKRTIESHRRNLIEKTHTKNTAELVKHALSIGLISA